MTSRGASRTRRKEAPPPMTLFPPFPSPRGALGGSVTGGSGCLRDAEAPVLAPPAPGPCRRKRRLLRTTDANKPPRGSNASPLRHQKAPPEHGPALTYRHRRLGPGPAPRCAAAVVLREPPEVKRRKVSLCDRVTSWRCRRRGRGASCRSERRGA